MKAQFFTAIITVDETKYNYSVLVILWSKLAISLAYPPAMDKYAALKDRLVKSFANSAEKKQRKLYKHDRRPS